MRPTRFWQSHNLDRGGLHLGANYGLLLFVLSKVHPRTLNRGPVVAQIPRSHALDAASRRTITPMTLRLYGASARLRIPGIGRPEVALSEVGAAPLAE